MYNLAEYNNVGLLRNIASALLNFYLKIILLLGATLSKKNKKIKGFDSNFFLFSSTKRIQTMVINLYKTFKTLSKNEITDF